MGHVDSYIDRHQLNKPTNTRGFSGILDQLPPPVYAPIAHPQVGRGVDADEGVGAPSAALSGLQASGVAQRAGTSSAPVRALLRGLHPKIESHSPPEGHRAVAALEAIN